MAVKRYIATQDSTITDAFKANLSTRMTSSNMGEADSLEVFYIAKQVSTSSAEKSRALVQFPITSVSTDRTNGDIPGSGSCEFYLKLFNVEHPFTLPRQATYVVMPISQSWSEGHGLDMEEGTDLAAVNWISASSGVPWTSEGGDFVTGTVFTQYLDRGHEDIEINISPLVEQWLDGSQSNYGVGIFLTSSQETGSTSYYTKKFSARGSEFFFKRPCLEVRWDDSKKDDRGYFFASSSLADATENLNTIYLYNYVRGQLRDIPGITQGDPIYVDVYDARVNGQSITPTPESPVTGGWVSTGIYSASFALDLTASTAYDIWSSGSTVYHTGVLNILDFGDVNQNPNPQYVTTITNLKDEYSKDETARFRVFTRARNWNPNVYVVATTEIKPDIIEDVYYQLERARDEFVIIPFGTGSSNHTRLSYDISGSYFDLDIDMLESDYQYQIRFLHYINGKYRVQKERHKFRVL